MFQVLRGSFVFEERSNRRASPKMKTHVYSVHVTLMFTFVTYAGGTVTAGECLTEGSAGGDILLGAIAASVHRKRTIKQPVVRAYNARINYVDLHLLL